MKRLVRFACLLCAACLLFSACTGPASSLPASSFEEAGQPQAADPFSQGTLTLASSPSGLIGSKYTSSPDGCYEIKDHGTGPYHSLLYIDYATRQRVYLSDNPAAGHKDESDPSYVGDTYGGLYQFFIDGKLYLYKCTSPLLLEINDYPSAYLSCILQMDPDGRNRKTLFTVPANAYVDETSAFAYDGGALYFMMDELDENGDRTAVSLMRVDTATGQQAALHTFADNARYYLVGAHGGSLVLKQLTLPTPKGQYPTTEEWLQQKHCLLLYCPATGQMKELFSWTQGELDGFCYQNGFYYIDAATASLRRLDLFSGKTETLLAQITDPDSGKPYGYVDAYRIYDGRLLLQTSDENHEHSDYLAFKLDDASLTRLTLQGDDGFASIWGESETEFLVKTGRIYFTQRALGPQNTEYLFESDAPAFSMIAKEDYWNNIPNFIPVEDHVFNAKVVE